MPFVYFIHEEGSLDMFKIGKTANHPADRIAQLQTGNYRKLIAYRWIEIGEHSMAEEYLHTRFVEQRVHGEWFRLTTEMIDEECEIVKLNDNSATLSNHWPEYTDKDVLAVKVTRFQAGTYGGSDPRARKNRFKYKR
jgi:hypothetical protein